MLRNSEVAEIVSISYRYPELENLSRNSLTRAIQKSPMLIGSYVSRYLNRACNGADRYYGLSYKGDIVADSVSYNKRYGGFNWVRFDPGQTPILMHYVSSKEISDRVMVDSIRDSMEFGAESLLLGFEGGEQVNFMGVLPLLYMDHSVGQGRKLFSHNLFGKDSVIKGLDDLGVVDHVIYNNGSTKEAYFIKLNTKVLKHGE